MYYYSRYWTQIDFHVQNCSLNRQGRKHVISSFSVGICCENLWKTTFIWKNRIRIRYDHSQKYTVKNSFSFSNLASILRLTSSISFLISNTSCDVSHESILSSSNKSANEFRTEILIKQALTRNQSEVQRTVVISSHITVVYKWHSLSKINQSWSVNYIIFGSGFFIGYLHHVYAYKNKYKWNVINCMNGQVHAKLICDVPNKSASPSIISSSSRISLQSSHSLSSKHENVVVNNS